MISIKQFITSVCRVFELLTYLRSHHQYIGTTGYHKSFVRQELIGKGFFAVNNQAGDSLNQKIRDITTDLGYDKNTINDIPFVSKSLVHLKQSQRNKKLHIAEHTYSIQEIILKLEKEFVLNNEKISINHLAIWFIGSSLMTLILKPEQKKGEETNSIDKNFPFTRYNNDILLRQTGESVSHWNWNNVEKYMATKFKKEISIIKGYNFTNDLEGNKNLYSDLPKKHRLPPLEIANEFYNDQFALLDVWYNHKRDKVLSAKPNTKFYNKELIESYLLWKKTCKPMSMVV